MPYGISIWGPMVASAVGGYMQKKSSQTTTPTLAREYLPLQKQLLAMINQRMMTGADMKGYTAAGQQNVNHTFDLIGGTQANNLTARGLGTSPVAGAVDATRENARGGAMAQFLNSVPQVQRDMQAQDLALATNIMGQGRGSTTTGASGGGIGGAMENLMAYIGYLQGQGKFPGQTPGTPPIVARQTVPGMGFLPPGGVSSMG